MKDKRVTVGNYNDDEAVRNEIRRAEQDVEFWKTFLQPNSDTRQMVVATIIGLVEMQKAN